MTDYQPLEHLSDLGAAVIREDFPSNHHGVYIPRLHTVYMKPDLHPHLERSVLAHEVVHAEDRTKHTRGNIERHRIIENRCDAVAARRLIGIEELAERIREDTDPGAWAHHLRVSGRMIRSRIAHLTEAELRFLKDELNMERVSW